MSETPRDRGYFSGGLQRESTKAGCQNGRIYRLVLATDSHTESCRAPLRTCVEWAPELLTRAEGLAPSTTNIPNTWLIVHKLLWGQTEKANG